MPEVRLIDANALKDDFCAMLFPTDRMNVLELIDKQPTIRAEQKHGRWIPTEYDSYADGAPVWDKFECSECGHEHSGEKDTLTAFCPDCGARMDGGADNG